jgi:CBS domain containing-hemolysin-like protein
MFPATSCPPSSWSSALIGINAFYVSAEFGAVGVRRSRIKWMAEGGNALARRLLPCIETPAGLSRVAASQIGITVSSLMLGAYAPSHASRRRDWSARCPAGRGRRSRARRGRIAVLLSLAALQAVVGELIPKSVALQFPTEVALATVLPMRWSLRVFRPFIVVINAVTTLILRLVGARLSPQRHVHSPDEIDLLLAESRDGGLLEPEEQQRLHRALRLGRRESTRAHGAARVLDDGAARHRVERSSAPSCRACSAACRCIAAAAIR